jgi:MoaA/NifB/PqqE/SkfB family radical SAM enzyme
MTGGRLRTAALVRLSELTNRTLVLPLVIFYPTSQCNSRCASCDWWKHSAADDLSLEEIQTVADSLPALGTRLVVFSGGEPLLRPEVFQAADKFRARGMTLHLLTSGVLLDRFAALVASHFSRVIVSLDATTEPLYRTVRGIAALATVERGVARLRRLAPQLPITARATLHRANFRELPKLIDRAKEIQLDGISFLAADVSTGAFGRDRPPETLSMALDANEIQEFDEIVERTIGGHQSDFESGFVAESPDRMRRLPQYYAALAEGREFPPVSCNAPWMSVVVEANGFVRPCFFHDPIGNVRRDPLETIVTRYLPAFRRTLDVTVNPVCRRCVCSMKTGWRGAPWQ